MQAPRRGSAGPRAPTAGEGLAEGSRGFTMPVIAPSRSADPVPKAVQGAQSRGRGPGVSPRPRERTHSIYNIPIYIIYHDVLRKLSSCSAVRDPSVSETRALPA